MGKCKKCGGAGTLPTEELGETPVFCTCRAAERAWAAHQKAIGDGAEVIDGVTARKKLMTPDDALRVASEFEAMGADGVTIRVAPHTGTLTVVGSYNGFRHAFVTELAFQLMRRGEAGR